MLIFLPEVHSSPLVLPTLAADWTFSDDWCVPLYNVRTLYYVEYSLLQGFDARMKYNARSARAYLPPYVMYMDWTRLHGESIL